MKFYNREKEIEELKRVQGLAFTRNSRMLVVTGRRRIGKTSLIKQAFQDDGSVTLYFFVGRKSESVLVSEFAGHVREVLSVFVPEGMISFSNLMQYLFELGKTRSFNLVIDEFQEFYNINETVFSDLQNLWDSYRQDTRVNLVICGSVFSLMQKIFTDHSEPLFGRADNILQLRPFKVEVLKQIMEEFAPGYSNDDLLALYTITGGVPKYVELFCDNDRLTVEKMYRFVFSEMSPFLDEGRNLLITEFGKNYGTYFSILQELANGYYTQGEIEARLGGIAIGVRYIIIDNFLSFWFKYIEGNRSYIELQNFDDLYHLAQADYPTYSGRVLEKYFRQKLAEAGGFKEIGSWWEMKSMSGKQKIEAFEIDIIALRARGNEALVAEVKRNVNNYNHKLFMEKVEHVKQKEMAKYSIETKFFSLKDM